MSVRVPFLLRPCAPIHGGMHHLPLCGFSLRFDSPLNRLCSCNQGFTTTDDSIASLMLGLMVCAMRDDSCAPGPPCLRRETVYWKGLTMHEPELELVIQLLMQLYAV